MSDGIDTGQYLSSINHGGGGGNMAASSGGGEHAGQTANIVDSINKATTQGIFKASVGAIESAFTAFGQIGLESISQAVTGLLTPPPVASLGIPKPKGIFSDSKSK